MHHRELDLPALAVHADRVLVERHGAHHLLGGERGLDGRQLIAQPRRHLEALGLGRDLHARAQAVHQLREAGLVALEVSGLPRQDELPLRLVPEIKERERNVFRVAGQELDGVL